MRAIFPLEATAGEPLPELEVPEWSQARAVDNLDIRQVPFAEFNGNWQGYSIKRDFAINPLARYPFKTFAHEAGHILLGHTTGKEPTDDYPIDRGHRGIQEFQAESMAHIALTELGMRDRFDPSESRKYLQDWLGKQKPTDDQIRPVFRATDTFVAAGRTRGQSSQTS